MCDPLADTSRLKSVKQASRSVFVYIRPPLSTLQVEEQSRLVEAAVTQPGAEGTSGWQRSGRRLGEELRRGCSEARRQNFQIRN